MENPTSLQPGNSIVKTFTIRTRRGIYFKPSTYRLNITIDYELNGSHNIDTIEHIINVRASLTSIIIGALIGGFAGWLVNKGQEVSFNIPNLMSLIISLLIASMAVVLLARKKEIQPIISVEDFWGGIAIGFFAAYSGPKFIEGIVSKGPNATGATLLRNSSNPF